MKIIYPLLTAVTFLAACPTDHGDDATAGTSTSTATMPPLTSDSTVDPTSGGAADETTGNASSGTTTPTSGGGESSTSGHPYDDSCIDPDPDPDFNCDRLVDGSRDFCDFVEQQLVVGAVPEPYAGFVRDMCAREEPACVVCFNLQNYCNTINDTTCIENLYFTCGCVKDAFGEP